MPTDRTIVYYTSNQEDPIFERRIQARLRETSRDHVPIISVSHRPMAFGDNICVGEQLPCDFNIIKQIYLGIEAAKTPWILVAEADSLYPPEYFTWTPTGDNTVWCYYNVWILSRWRRSCPNYYFKGRSEGMQMIRRDPWLQKCEAYLRVCGSGWKAEVHDPRADPFLNEEYRLGWGWGRPDMHTPAAISLKTGAGLRHNTRTVKYIYPEPTLAPFGDADALWRSLTGGQS